MFRTTAVSTWLSLAVVILVATSFMASVADAQTAPPPAARDYSLPTDVRTTFMNECMQNGGNVPYCSCSLRAVELTWSHQMYMDIDTAARTSAEQRTERQQADLVAATRLFRICARDTNAFQAPAGPSAQW